MTGAHRYRLHFAAGTTPPAGAFWLLIAYDLQNFTLIENPLARYSIGNRTPGLRYNADGSLDVHIQKAEPPAGRSNWLPVGSRFVRRLST